MLQDVLLLEVSLKDNETIKKISPTEEDLGPSPLRRMIVYRRISD